MKRRFLSVFLCICMVLMLTPTMAFASEAASAETAGGLQVVDAGYFIKGEDAEAYFTKALGAGKGQDCGDDDPIMYIRFNQTTEYPVLIEFSVDGKTYAIYGKQNISFGYWSLGENKTQVDFEKEGTTFKRRNGSSFQIINENAKTVTLDGVFELKNDVAFENLKTEVQEKEWTKVDFAANLLGKGETELTLNPIIGENDVGLAPSVDASADDPVTQVMDGSETATATASVTDPRKLKVSLKVNNLNYHQNGVKENGYWVRALKKSNSLLKELGFFYEKWYTKNK